jgi:hypothetical protein
METGFSTVFRRVTRSTWDIPQRALRGLKGCRFTVSRTDSITARINWGQRPRAVIGFIDRSQPLGLPRLNRPNRIGTL